MRAFFSVREVGEALTKKLLRPKERLPKAETERGEQRRHLEGAQQQPEEEGAVTKPVLFGLVA